MERITMIWNPFESILLIVLVLTAMIVIPLAVILVHGAKRRRFAETETSPGLPFKLNCTIPRRGRVAVWMRFHIRYSDVEINEDDYGLVCTTKVRINGVDSISEIVGMGNRLHTDVDRSINSFSSTSNSSILGRYAFKATVKLADLGLIEESTVVQLSGMITCAEYTEADRLTIWIGT
jgi:hypothetical protein